jgi:multidrug efflux system outer membrane protein
MTRKFALSLMLPILAAACSGNYREYLHEPTTSWPHAFREAPPAFVSAAPPDDTWWRALNDPVLDQLVARAVSQSWDVRAAEADLRQARAVARLQGWTLLPSLNATATAQRQRDSALIQNGPSTTIPGANEDSDFFSAGLTASWEPDVFGRLRGDVRAARADALSAEAAERGVLVAVAAETAAQYIALRSAQSRLSAARANVESQRETLRLTSALREVGNGTRLDVARAREQLAATETSAAALEGDVRAALYGLSTLVGRGGMDIVEPLSAEAPIPEPPEQFNAGSPEDLLRRRPDIVQAEQNLISAAHRAAQRGDWWPRISLLGGIGVSAFRTGDLSEDSALSFNIGPQIDWPLLDIRRNMLRQAAREAQAEAEYERFDRAVAAGLADTEAALATYISARRAAGFARESAAAAKEAAGLARLRYREGVDPFLQVLDAERREAEADDRRAIAEARSATAYVRLGQALGAGWAEAAPPSRRLPGPELRPTLAPEAPRSSPAMETGSAPAP